MTETLRIVADFVGLTLGVLVGLLIAALITIFKDVLFEALWELFSKQGEDPLIESSATQVLVSDIHIDTWTYPPSPGLRAMNFMEFLFEVARTKDLNAFVLNGDVMDIPENPGPDFGMQVLNLHVGGDVPDQGPLDPKFAPVQAALASLGTDELRFYYQTGNHDIGITGLRYTRRVPPVLFPKVIVSWNPGITIDFGINESSETCSTYLEHGHHYDPALALYIRTAVFDLLRGADFSAQESLFRGFQRHGKKGPGKTALRNAQIQRIQGSAAVEEAPTSRSTDRNKNWDFADATLTFAQKVLRLKYRWAARMIVWQLKKKDRWNVRAITMGHIHIPDRYVFGNGVVYINSGDWCGNTAHQCYVVMYQDGRVGGPYQWVSPAEKRF